MGIRPEDAEHALKTLEAESSIPRSQVEEVRRILEQDRKLVISSNPSAIDLFGEVTESSAEKEIRARRIEETLEDLAGYSLDSSANAPPPEAGADGRQGDLEEVASLGPSQCVELLNAAKFRNAHDKPWTTAALKRRVDRAAKGRVCGEDRLRRLDEALVQARVPGRYLFRVGPLCAALEEIVRGCATRDRKFDDLLTHLDRYRDMQGS